MTKMNPNSVKKPAVTARLPPENRRLANTDTSNIGWLLRHSHSANPTRTIAAAMKPPLARVLVHPQLGASMMV
ncbi:hypothetical protein KST_00245 [Mycobacterium marinum]|nr:hypothetical protein KST_00245 [Mycobacterium marinum]